MRLGHWAGFILVLLTTVCSSVPTREQPVTIFKNETSLIILVEGHGSSNVLLQSFQTRKFLESSKPRGPRTYYAYDFQPIAAGTTLDDDNGLVADLLFCRQYSAQEVADRHFTVRIMVNVKNGVLMSGAHCPPLQNP